MPRYFIELAYKGTAYSGFQVQENANTIQSEIEKAFSVLHRNGVVLTGSSRTDAGVHALQNFFHFDFEGIHPQFVYKMNALLPRDIAIKNVHLMPAEAHARFDAISRKYGYRVHRFKNPFLLETSYFFPYALDTEVLAEAAAFVGRQSDFYAFSKTNTQTTHFECSVSRSEWVLEEGKALYTIEANRFLRGMVRLLTGSMLKLARGKLSMNQFKDLFKNRGKAGYSVPAQGLFLESVDYPEGYFSDRLQGQIH